MPAQSPAKPAIAAPSATATFTGRRLHTPLTATVHYVTEFTLGPKDCTLTDAFAAATTTLRLWCDRKTSARDYAQRIETHGGVATCPASWALHVRHADSDNRRYWYTDVALVQREGCFDVRVTVSYALDFGYVGWQPPPPEPSAPNFVCDWLGNPRLVLRSGLFPIAMLARLQPRERRSVKDRITAMAAQAENAHELARLIFDPSRALPVLLINGDVNPVTFPLYPNGLQQALFGLCYVVCTEPGIAWAQAWHAHFPAEFDCRHNTVRLYLGGASKTVPYDSVRHRYFTADDIVAHGGSLSFTTMIRDGLTRRLLMPRHGRIANCEDVLSQRAAEEFASHKAKLNTKEEEAAFLEAEYSTISERLKTSDQLLVSTDEERAKAVSELESLRPRVEELTRQVELAKTSTPAAFDHSHLLERFYLRKETLEDFLKAIQVMYGSAVVVLPSALESAREAEGFEWPDLVREFVFKLVTDFRDCLIAGKGTHDGVRIFGRKRFSTKEADNLTQRGRVARTFPYKGKMICMEQHLKIGVKESDAHTLRLHYHWDAESKKIVIAHCGAHLPL